ncbi:RHS repeat-associated core domain-containing protein [Marinilabiliaceae bacterium JC017]|nr:RHS repeat-associated core domain-containing protein [Marinilabiliaceae bacterium JC017]
MCYDKSKTRKIHYISGGNGLAALYIIDEAAPAKNGLYFAHTDYQGSLIALSRKKDDAINIEKRFAYDPWGNRRNPDDWTKRLTNAGNLLTSRGYTMHEHLDGFALINMNGRVFDPQIARFLSPDPYIQAPGNWLNYNRYAYGYNNPFMFTDPNGESALVALGIIVLSGMAIDYAFQVICNYTVQHASGKDINWGNVIYGNVDFFDVVMAGVFDGVTLGISKLTKLPKLVRTGFKITSVLVKNTLIANVDIRPNSGIVINDDPDKVKASIISSSFTDFTFGKSYGFGLEKIAGKKYIGDLASKRISDIVKNFAIKTSLSIPINKYKEGTRNSLFRDTDLFDGYYYNEETNDWKKKLRPQFDLSWQN